MGFCKYCKKPIIDKRDMCNPDGNGNGYHNECFVEMQIIMRNKAIYDKGKNDVLDKIRAEIEKKHARAKQMSSVLQMNAYTDCLQIIDKYRESE